jgi:hypothetical protein
MDRKLGYLINQFTPEYHVGIESFMQFVRDHEGDEPMTLFCLAHADNV